jgi:hypothetical protein
MNQAIDHGFNLNDGDVVYSELETATSWGIICRCSLLLRASENTIHYWSYRLKLLKWCPLLADISLPGIRCTFACQNKSIQVCALRRSNSLAQWPKFYILSLQNAECPANPAYYWCFPDDGVASLNILLQRARDRACLRLPQTTGEDWNFFRPCFGWHTVVHSGDIQE